MAHCLCICYKLVFYHHCPDFHHGTTHGFLCYKGKGNSGILKRALPHRNLNQTLNLADFSFFLHHDTVTVASAANLVRPSQTLSYWAPIHLGRSTLTVTMSITQLVRDSSDFFNHSVICSYSGLRQVTLKCTSRIFGAGIFCRPNALPVPCHQYQNKRMPNVTSLFLD